MKKIFEKIVSITLALVSVLFVALLILLMFKPDYVDSLNNQLVKILILIFSALFVVLSGLNIYGAFHNNDKLQAVLLFKGKTSATKATIGVVKKWVKSAAKGIEGARVTRVQLFVDENNDVRLKANLKIKKDTPVMNIVTRVKAAVQDTIFSVLGLELSSIDFTLTGVKNNYKSDVKIVETKAEKETKEIEAIKEKEKALREESEEKEITTSVDTVSEPETEVVETTETEESLETEETEEAENNQPEEEVEADDDKKDTVSNEDAQDTEDKE